MWVFHEARIIAGAALCIIGIGFGAIADALIGLGAWLADQEIEEDE